MEISFQGGSIHYKAEGMGPAIVLLHGFMESARVWRDYSARLVGRYKVIRVNLPGHGKSSVYGNTHSMEFMAEAVKAVLDAEDVNQAMLVGHSMGGYVSLAFAEKYPTRVSALVLFHSSCFADTKEKKIDRDRAVRAAEAHKMKYITSVIPNLFFDRSGIKASKRIFKLVKLASKQPKEGITAALLGMRDRKDRSKVWASLPCPAMLLAGHDDLLIPLERSQEVAALNPKAQFVVLSECGHVGFMEQKREAFRVLELFARAKVL